MCQWGANRNPYTGYRRAPPWPSRPLNPKAGVKNPPLNLQPNGWRSTKTVSRAHFSTRWLAVKWCIEQSYSFCQSPEFVNANRTQYVWSSSSPITIVGMTLFWSWQYLIIYAKRLPWWERFLQTCRVILLCWCRIWWIFICCILSGIKLITKLLTPKPRNVWHISVYLFRWKSLLFCFLFFNKVTDSYLVSLSKLSVWIVLPVVARDDQVSSSFLSTIWRRSTATSTDSTQLLLTESHVTYSTDVDWCFLYFETLSQRVP